MSVMLFERNRRLISLILLVLFLTAGELSGQSSRKQSISPPGDNKKGRAAPVAAIPRVTFIELGSVRCIPCKQMQPIMKSVESKYGGQIRVIFHDVWTEEGKPQADIYKIKLIPTQVFLDESGKEFFRHEGFYPEREIDKLLQKRGLKVRNERPAP